jgi:hypothetical protein
MADVEKPVIEKKKKGRALRPDEIQEILKYCAGQLRLVFLTALLTGMRPLNYSASGGKRLTSKRTSSGFGELFTGGMGSITGRLTVPKPRGVLQPVDA